MKVSNVTLSQLEPGKKYSFRNNLIIEVMENEDGTRTYYYTSPINGYSNTFEPSEHSELEFSELRG